MVDLTFFEKRSSNLLLYIIVIAIVLLLLYMVWPWKTALILTLWAGYVLWWPTVWLEKYIHRRGLAALIVIIVTGVFLAFALVNLTVIVAQELAQIVAGASSSSNAQLSQGLTTTFQLANPDLAKSGPILAIIGALRHGRRRHYNDVHSNRTRCRAKRSTQHSAAIGTAHHRFLPSPRHPLQGRCHRQRL